MIEINNKQLCENCFSEISEERCPNCGYSSADPIVDRTVLPAGTTLVDKIIVGKVMGKGGFGITYLGYDIRMSKIIAIKEYYPNGIAYRSNSGIDVLLADPKSEETFEKGAEKFYSEAEMVSQFNGNPNIVSVYDFFRTNNTVYLVMEFINGVTLKNYVKRHGSISDGQALFIMNKMASALSITHSANVLHRDISPDNIMICADGKIKLIDFGAARQILAESSSNLTVVLKPGYTPIEQYTKKGMQGAWTDIYALGASIYYALTCTVLDDPYERMENDEEFSSNKHKINNSLWKILKKCTMINSSERYATAIDLKKDLLSVTAPVKPEPIILSAEDTVNFSEEETGLPQTSKASGKVAFEEKTDSGKETYENKEDPSKEKEQEKPPVPEAPVVDEVGNVTDDLPVDSMGYDPSVNVYKHKNKGKGKLISWICAAAAVIAVGVTGIFAAINRNDNISENQETTASGSVSETTVETASETTVTTERNKKPIVTTEHTLSEDEIIHEKLIEMDSVYPGDRVESTKSIYKASLYGFEGDMKVTLDLEFVDSMNDIDGNYKRMLKITDSTGDFSPQVFSSNVNVLNGWYDIGVDEFFFVISHDDYVNLSGRLKFQGVNLYVKSAYVEDYDPYAVPDHVKIAVDKRYPGAWELSNFIPKSEFMAFGGDVKVTLNIGVIDQSLDTDGNYNHYIKPSYTSINGNWQPANVTSFTTDGVNILSPHGYTGDDQSVYDIGKDDDTVSFVISRADIEDMDDFGMTFQVFNVIVYSAELTAP